MLKKKNRLISTKDFDQVYREGVKIRGDYGMLSVLKIEKSEIPPKIGFVVGKKIGNAVKRHKHTRRLREISREFFKLEPDIKGLKVTYIAHKYVENFDSLKKEMMGQFSELKKYSN